MRGGSVSRIEGSVELWSGVEVRWGDEVAYQI